MPLQTQQIPEETAAPLSPSSARLSDTTETAHAISNSTVAELLEAAENAEQARRANTKMWQVVLCLIISAMIVAFFLRQSPTLLFVLNGAFSFTLINVIISRLPNSSRKSRQHQDAVAALLPYTGEPRLLLPLIDSLNTPQTLEWKAQAYPVLIDRLEKLSATNAALSLDATRRTALRNVLSFPYVLMPNFKRQASDGHFDDANADLAVAVMQTLASIGDKNSVKVLQKIIKADANRPNETVVRDAAREYLPVLTQKIAEDIRINKNIWACLAERIRSPQKVLREYLDTLPSEAAKLALVNFLYLERQRSLMVRGAYFIAALCTAVFGSWFLLSGVANKFPHSAGLSGAFGAIVALVFNLLYSGGRRYTFARSVQKLVVELSHRTEYDVRMIGTLLSFAQSGLDKQNVDAVTKAIARLLPLLQPGDAALVPPAQRAYLRSWLKLPPRKSKRGASGKGNTSQTLAILALNALGTIGDTKAMPAAEAIARRTTRGNYHEADLHEAALRCVDALRMRKG